MGELIIMRQRGQLIIAFHKSIASRLFHILPLVRYCLGLVPMLSIFERSQRDIISIYRNVYRSDARRGGYNNDCYFIYSVGALILFHHLGLILLMNPIFALQWPARAPKYKDIPFVTLLFSSWYLFLNIWPYTSCAVKFEQNSFFSSEAQ